MKPTVIVFMSLWLCVITGAYADTIYTWTDHDGTQHYSNTPPPEDIKQFKVLESTETSENSPARRPGYDRMVQQSTAEAERLEQQRRDREKVLENERKRADRIRRKAQIESKRQELEQKIEAIQKRAVSPSFPQGMKAAQIQHIQNQIKQLEEHPANDQ